VQTPTALQKPAGHGAPSGERPSAGHAALAPVQLSIASQSAALGRQLVVAGASASAGQTIATPSHDSAASQRSVAARHDVPAARGPIETHSGAPLLQSIWPASHAFPVLHGVPATHTITHAPDASHSPPGHGVPTGARMSAGHVDTVPSQRSATSHGPVAARHGAPDGATPAGAHTGVMPMHTVRPAPQLSATTQTSPATHVVQPVVLHARPTPHAVPGGRSSVPTHTPTPPPLQSSRPVVHGLLVSHEAPSTQTLHEPAPPHTPVVPHVVPGGTSSVAMQTGLPEPQSKRPLEHGLRVSQTAPSVQMAHEPSPLHASPAPQPTPDGRSLVATHTAVPDAQSVWPLEHGLPVSHTAS